MKRLFSAWLALCVLLLAVASLGAAPTPAPQSDTASEESNAVPVPPDPNWVLAADAEETAEAFKTSDAPLRQHGMRPLSTYAQVHPVTEEDLVLAARVAYFEAGASSERSYRAVLCVLYNRCVAKRFGGEVTDISTETYRKGQFSVIHNAKFETFDPPEELIEAARDIFVYGNLDLPESILFFCAEKLGKGWGGRKFYQSIGGNLFFYGATD